MILETDRLRLRPWEETDAPSLYECAKDPRVGPAAGWSAHPDAEHSLNTIRKFLSSEGTFAITLKDNGIAIGAVGLSFRSTSKIDIGDDEANVGYWIGVPFWNRGLVTEAVHELMRYAFEDLGISVLWCGYFDGNERSKRVQEKCGFRYHHTEYDKERYEIGMTVTEHISRITKEEWSLRDAQF